MDTDRSVGAWSLDDVVTSASDNKKFRSLINSPYGMILLTGPTGCGKTTTLYSVLQVLSTPDKNIITVEDPVEYRLKGITQVQVNPVAGMTFASGLRSIVRQDPDIILVGEIRDLETADIPAFLVASALLGAVAQRLVRTCCDKCKQSYKPSQEELGYLQGLSNRGRNVSLYRSRGCTDCCQAGYYGRKAIFEILTATPEIRRMVVTGCSDDEIKAQAIKEGMKTLRASGIEEALAGTTTFEELLRVVDMRQE